MVTEMSTREQSVGAEPWKKLNRGGTGLGRSGAVYTGKEAGDGGGMGRSMSGRGHRQGDPAAERSASPLRSVLRVDGSTHGTCVPGVAHSQWRNSTGIVPKNRFIQF